MTDEPNLGHSSASHLSRRGALGGIGAGALGTAGCLGEDQAALDPNTPTDGATGGGAPAAVDLDQQSGIRYVESASEMNQALQDLPETGGMIRWKPGSYTGEDFTEMVTIPAGFRDNATSITLDMRSVDITISGDAPYRGEAGAFFYRPPTDSRSKSINILGPHALRIEGTFEDVDPTGGVVAENEADQEGTPFYDDDPSPHAFYLYDTSSCRIAPVVKATNVDRILYFRQSHDCGHQVWTKGFRSWGGNVAIHVGDERDGCGKDRSHWFGQTAGYASSATLLEKALNNRVWVQAENPRPDHDRDVTGHRVRAGQNALMLIHIQIPDEDGRPGGRIGALDIQARNTSIFNSATTGNPQPFYRNRMGIRPSNVYMGNYRDCVYDFTMDHRPNLALVENGDGTVGYDGREGEITLQAGSQGRAGIATPGPAGRMGHHTHGYVDARIVGQEAGRAPAVFRFGAWADADNHAMITYDPRNDDHVSASIKVSGESLGASPSSEYTGATLGGTGAPDGWIAYVRHDYQAFFHDYNLVWESFHDLSDWPMDPKLRADVRNTGNTDAMARLRTLEFGLAMKDEAAEEFVTQRGKPTDGNFDRPWRRDGLQVG
jgi:hypothetical protein